MHWKNFDAFVRWAAYTGYVKYANLRRTKAEILSVTPEQEAYLDSMEGGMNHVEI